MCASSETNVVEVLSGYSNGASIEIYSGIVVTFISGDRNYSLVTNKAGYGSISIGAGNYTKQAQMDRYVLVSILRVDNGDTRLILNMRPEGYYYKMCVSASCDDYAPCTSRSSLDYFGSCLNTNSVSLKADASTFRVVLWDGSCLGDRGIDTVIVDDMRKDIYTDMCLTSMGMYTMWIMKNSTGAYTSSDATDDGAINCYEGMTDSELRANAIILEINGVRRVIQVDTAKFRISIMPLIYVFASDQRLCFYSDISLSTGIPIGVGRPLMFAYPLHMYYGGIRVPDDLAYNAHSYVLRL